jgi:hypothetical protein
LVLALQNGGARPISAAIKPTQSDTIPSDPPGQKQVALVHSCYRTKTTRPERLLQCIRDEWGALKSAAIAPLDGCKAAKAL